MKSKLSSVKFSALFFLVLSNCVSAFTWQPGSHKTYTGDVNADGRTDILLRASRINSTVGMPYGMNLLSQVISPQYQDIILYGNEASGYQMEFDPFVSKVGDGVWNPANWVQTGVDPALQDVDGDGINDLIIAPYSQGAEAAILFGNASGSQPVLSNPPRLVQTPPSQIIAARGNSIGDPNTYALDGAQYVGLIEGDFSVNAAGKPQYVVPLQLVPSVRNIAPDLSVSYSGTNANGLLGAGWNLDGISKIERCPTILERDGYLDGINFNRSDRFCLNGEMLVAITGVYGQSGAEYRTENESPTKIISYGSTAQGPQYFRVWKPNGEVETYGNTADSRLERSGDTAVHTWSINRIEDNEGNFVTFHYSNAKVPGAFNLCTATVAGEFLPCQINYTGNGATSPANSVRFEYETRTDGFTLNSHGLTRAINKRLKHIRAFQESTNVRRYSLNYAYGAESKVSRVTQLDECLRDGNCVKPTTFVWKEGTATVSFSRASSELDTQAYSSGRPYKNSQFHNIDVNGDGRQDLVWTYRDVNSLGWVLYAANGSGTGLSKVNSGTITGFNADLASEYDQRFLAGDVNGDGRGDLIWIGRRATDVYRLVLTSTGTGFSNRGYQVDASNDYNSLGDSKFLTGDTNGDGLTDVVWVYKRGGTINFAVYHAYATSSGVGLAEAGVFQDSSFSPSHYTNQQFLPGDVNGDGKTDIVWVYSYSNELVRAVFLATPNGASFQKLSVEKEVNIIPNLSTLTDPLFHLGDVNGDDRDDLVFTYRYSGNARVRLYQATANGTNFSFKNELTHKPNNLDTSMFTSSSIRLADLNNDGKADLVYSHSYGSVFGWAIYLANNAGDNFGYHQSGTSSDANSTFIQQEYLLGDINADSRPDLVWAYQDGNRQIGRVSLVGPVNAASSNLAYPDHLSIITDGFGNQVVLGYRHLSDAANPIFTKGTGAAYPLRDDPGLGYALSSVQKTNGVGGYRTWNYVYGGARTHLKGRGFLGFDFVESTDSGTGFVQRDRYLQSWPYIGLVSSTEVLTAGGTPVERTYNHWKSHSLFTSNRSAFRYLADTVSIKYQPGSSTPMLSALVTTTYDSYGFKDVESRLVGRGFSGAIGSAFNRDGVYSSSDITGLVRSISIDYTYAHNATDWRLGFVTNEEIVASAPGLTSRTVTNSYSPRSSTSYLRASETLFSGTNFQKSVTYTGFDGWGNATQISVTGRDYDGSSLPTRTTSYGSFDSGLYPTYEQESYSWNRLTLSHNRTIGKVIKSVGPNGNTIDTLYDDFGRLVYTKDKNGVDSHHRYFFCGASCPSNGAYYVQTRVLRNGNRIAPDNIEYFDMQGRSIREESADFSGRTVLTSTQYDALGRVERESKPYYPNESTPWVVYEHDQINRVLKETRPDGSYISNAYSSDSTYSTRMASEQRIIDTVSGNRSTNTTTITNALNEVVETIDHNGTSTRFVQDVWGHPATTTVANNSATQVTAVFDNAGRKSRLTDPDVGIVQFDYDAFGNLRRKIFNPGANQHAIVSTYDLLDRKLTQTDVTPQGSVQTGSWVYDNKSGGLGEVGNVTGPDYAEEYEYDSLSRVQRKSITLFGGLSRNFHYRYDSAGRIERTYYPAELIIENAYNTQGYLSRQIAVNDSIVVWEGRDGDRWGNVTSAMLGNGLSTSRTYSNVYGLPTNISAGLVQNIGLTHDSAGNFVRRSNNAGQSFTETFTYDGLNRLKTASTIGLPSGSRSLSYDYDVLGNIKTKTGVSDTDGYYYGENGAGPHAVSRTVLNGVTTSYRYDAKGNMINNGNKTLSYTVFNVPSSITVGSTASNFLYNPDRERYYQRLVEGGRVTETLYFNNGAYEIVKDGNNIRQKAYVGDYLVHQSLLTGNDINQASIGLADLYQYVHRDHLGSAEVVTDGAGAIVARNYFDPYGLRRKTTGENADAAYLAGLKSSTLQTTTRGFTDHEQLDAVGLIHMNGRVYDPTLGRFLSPDDHVQFPYLSQSYNRYSYVLNNPASYQDPSGEIIPIIVGAAVVAYKAYNVYDTVTEGVGDVKTLISDEASTTDKVLSGASLVGGIAGIPKPIREIGGSLITGAKKVSDKLSKSHVDVDVTDSAKGGKNLADSAVTPDKELKQNVEEAAKADVVNISEIEGSNVAKGAKRGPKTDPTAPHNAKIREIADQIEAQGGRIIAGGGRKDLPERLIPTVGGHKNGRRPDILYKDCNGNLCGVNVGRTKADGSPVTREQKALDDLNGLGGVPTRFERYD